MYLSAVGACSGWQGPWRCLPTSLHLLQCRPLSNFSSSTTYQSLLLTDNTHSLGWIGQYCKASSQTSEINKSSQGAKSSPSSAPTTGPVRRTHMPAARAFSILSDPGIQHYPADRLQVTGHNTGLRSRCSSIAHPNHAISMCRNETQSRPAHHASNAWISSAANRQQTLSHSNYTCIMPYYPYLGQQFREWQQRRHFALVKETKPITLDDVVRRHRKGTMNRGFMVIELYSNGATLDLTTPLSASDLGIPFRDAMLFSSENTVTDQRPAILVRQGSILFKSDAIRAVINNNKAYIIKVKMNRSYNGLLEPLKETVKQDDAIPFELNVLEGLLYVSCRWFDTRIRHLKSIMDGLMRDVNDSTEPFAAVYNEALIQQSAPLDKAITSLRNSSRDTCEAVRHLLENEDMLTDICLTQKKQLAKHLAELQLHLGDSGCGPSHHSVHDIHRQTPSHYYADGEYQSHKEQARRMLESYDRELDAISGQLDEMRENLDTVRDSWSMKLDSARNHIILLNLKMTLASLCLMAAAMLPAWGGMNINHGMPDEPWVFWSVSAVSIVLGIIMYPIADRAYRLHWQKRSLDDLRRFHSLRAFLVEHLDDLDEVIDAVKKITGKMNRRQFELYMREAMPTATWKPASLDFLFSQYDLNKDGFLEGIEIAKKEAVACEKEVEHLPEFMRRGLHIEDLYANEEPQPMSWGQWLMGKQPLLQHDPGHMSYHEKRGWLSRLWNGSPAGPDPLEERSGGRVVRH